MKESSSAFYRAHKSTKLGYPPPPGESTAQCASREAPFVMFVRFVFTLCFLRNLG